MYNQNSKSILHIGFTGHRPPKLGGYNISTEPYRILQRDLEDYIAKQLEHYHTVVGHSGLALGGDTIWSKAILAMKERFPDRVKFHAEIPMLEQAEAWFRKTDIDFWHEQVRKADYQTVYGSLKGLTNPERKKMASVYLNKRNEGMLDHSDVLLALWDGSSGGTGNAVAYGRRTNMEIVIVHPRVYFGSVISNGQV